jgi:parallel beta-helix repeat protein
VVYISKTVTIRGGYNADFSAWDPDTYPTTLDAQGQGRVLYITGDISSTIEGLHITGGNTADRGGGVYVITATVTIRDNLIISNTADSHGGGLYIVVSSAATLISNTFRANATGWLGGGGGLCVVASDATLNGNTFISNAAHWGGGLDLVFSTAALHDNTISYNAADGGGGLALVDSDATLINSVVADNWANSYSSGLGIAGSSLRLLHTTIARNSGGDGSGVYVTNFGADYSTVAFTNTILVSHTVGITVTGGNTATLEATLWANDTDWGGVGTVITGAVNIWGDPAFVAPDAGDYHIAAVSAARDAGVNAGATEDFDGESRPSDGFYDIGADEYYPHPALSVSQQAVPGLVQGGLPLTYTIHVANAGNVDLHAIITDTLPEHVTTTQPLVWASQVIPTPGGVWTQQVVVTVEMGYTGPLINVVQVTTEEGATGVYTETVTSGYKIYLPLIMRQYP